MDLGVVDELMQALSASKVELALEKEAATPLKQKLMRAQSEAEQLQERLDSMQESANAERFEVLDVHTVSFFLFVFKQQSSPSILGIINYEGYPRCWSGE